MFGKGYHVIFRSYVRQSTNPRGKSAVCLSDGRTLMVNCKMSAMTTAKEQFLNFSPLRTENHSWTRTCLVAANFFCRCSMVSSATRILRRASSSASFLLSFLSLSSRSRTRIRSSSTCERKHLGGIKQVFFCNL